MVLKADLQCCRCYKKVKKVLCKFPEIQDQVFKEKENLVLITVVCCCPEKLKKKIICKGGGSITCIEIKEPEKKPEPKKPVQKAKPQLPQLPPRPGREPPKGKQIVDAGDPPPPPPRSRTQAIVVGKPPEAAAVPAYPCGAVVCCGPCSQGGPCQYGHGYGRPPNIMNIEGQCMIAMVVATGVVIMPPQNYEYGRPVYDSYGGGYRSGYQVSRCDNYFSDENPTVCTVIEYGFNPRPLAMLSSTPHNNWNPNPGHLTTSPSNVVSHSTSHPSLAESPSHLYISNSNVEPFPNPYSHVIQLKETLEKLWFENV
ncbi:protein PYRICULARIA ORYZAE RESISTANCE 21 isoform X2 [Fagus crenata]